MHINDKCKHSELTSKIIGCTIEVHKYLGNGFQEIINQRALEIEFRLKGINAQREFVMPTIKERISAPGELIFL
jgi:GxxExxY protein